ncbi:MAG: translation initiation factor IF-2 [Candidatus Yanofskybacteria bacterium]|nr:translation initiation factor IF-2 [Candidatus Yanofskybacteria bacterium]
MPSSHAKQLKSEIRPPIVVVLGHVDHGKSSLLEAIRQDFQITSKESGGITQQIGAYEAEYQGRPITFLDTPGHEAFSAMRSRGAKVADIALLVVAADEGVKPQTKEAIQQIQKADIPFIVVANKIDKPEANPERLKQELSQVGVLVEGYGGDVPFAATSALTKQGIPELLELALLLADMQELQGDPAGHAVGTVIESSLDPKRGPSTTLLVRRGTLRPGSFVATESVIGKVRLMEDFQGTALKEAGPAKPVSIVGFEKAPFVGEEFRSFDSKEEAVSFLQAKKQKPVPKEQGSVPEDEGRTIRLLLKADTTGSLEALEQVVAKLPAEYGTTAVVRAAVGEIGEDDVSFAQSAKALILGFRVKETSRARELAERSKVSVATFSIIYEAADHVSELLKQEARKELVQEEKGRARILAVFKTGKTKHILGGKVHSGEIRKNMKVQLVRGEETIGEGQILNIQHNKENVSFVPEGEEFGMEFQCSQVPQEKDILVLSIEKQREV